MSVCDNCQKDRPCVRTRYYEDVGVGDFAGCHECTTPDWLKAEPCDDCREAELELADILLGPEDCHLCDGTGEIAVSRPCRPSEETGGLSELTGQVRCEACGGSGRAA